MHGSSQLYLIRQGVRRLRAPEQFGKGEVLKDGRALMDYTRHERAAAMAYIPQVSQVAFPFSVREVVRLGRYLAGRGIPIVFLTGYGRGGLPEPYRRHAVIDKPVDPEKLAAAVAAALAASAKPPGRD